MKQHMLTHKIRDMPQHMFGSPTSSATASNSSEKSGRRSADYPEEKTTRRSHEDSPNNSNNNNQREKNNNHLEGKLKQEPGMKRPTTVDAEEAVQAKRPLSE